MMIQEYLAPFKEFQRLLINFIDSFGIQNEEYENLINFYINQNFQNDKDELREICTMISKITKNYHRVSDYFEKTEQIILFLAKDIQSTFTNLEIYDIFRNNRQIILILLSKEMIKIDEAISHKIYIKEGTLYTSYRQFFYPEIKPFLTEEDCSKIESQLLNQNSDIFTNFDEKRRRGENDNEIFTLIRNDSITEFISYLNKTETPPEKIFKNSIFETNSYLVRQSDVQFSTYSVYFGSLKILTYLLEKQVKLTKDEMFPAIHSKNIQMIHLIEDQTAIQNDDIRFISDCVIESIKCHHNNIADYFINNYSDVKQDDVIENCFKYYNFQHLPENSIKNYFFYACKYNHLAIVKFLLNNTKIDINERIVLINYYLFNSSLFNMERIWKKKNFF